MLTARPQFLGKQSPKLTKTDGFCLFPQRMVLENIFRLISTDKYKNVIKY